MRSAYADPPYLGLAEKFYGDRHPEAAAFDDPRAHADLIARMSDEFDAWALSLHEPSLRVILSMCPDDVRVAAWVKPFCSFKKGVKRAWSWEPVIFRWHRARKPEVDALTWRDHVSAGITMRRGFPGAKPDAFSYWIFEGLGLEAGDEFVDLFPGSGAVSAAWERWRAAKRGEFQMALVEGAR